MHQIIFVASADSVATMEADENPSQAYPCMSSQQFHRDARAQLYALVTGEFLLEASEMEYLDQTLTEEGPFIYILSAHLLKSLARLDEDDVEALSLSWMQCEEIEALDLDANDLHDFMFQLVHFSQIAFNDDLNVYIYSDD
ncbi:MAG: hypothetical protein JKY88_06035 [Pseudomonadales bacterium]|nr:hypothetical protein [Pseudomonadales bacterium]